MRFLEGAIFLVYLFTVALFIKDNARHLRLFKYLPSIAIGIFVVHWLVEGLRWQLFPLYFIIIVSFILSIFNFTKVVKLESLYRSKLLKRISAGFMILFLVISAGSAYAFPVYKMSKPTGEFKIGTVSYDITDDSRSAIYSDNLKNKRRIKIQVWYPAGDVKGLSKVPWLQDGPVVAKQVSKVMSMPDFVFSHTALIMSNSYKNAPISNSEVKYPIVIISHGWTGFRNLHTDVAELLASNGYIVISIDHTYGSAVTVFNDGEITFLNREALPKREITPDFLNYANTLVETYAGDIKLTINQLERYNLGEKESIFKGRLDLDSIGLLGHSTGGGADVSTALDDNRVKAVMGMDAWVEPIKKERIEKGLTVPALFLRSEQWENSLNNENLMLLLDKSLSQRELYEIYGIKHMDFSMAYMYSPLSKYLNITGKLDGWKGAEIQQDFILNFFNKNLKRQTNIQIHNLDPKYDEVKKIY